VEGREPGEELVAAFARWAAQERTRSAATDRARQRSLGEQALATATWTGILVDLAEQGAEVTVSVGGRRYTGWIVGVGQDFCVVEQAVRRRPALIPLPHISYVSADQSGRATPSGDRPTGLALSMAAALAALAEERAPVALQVGGDQMEGEVIGVGEDVVTLRSNPPTGRLVHVPLAAVTFCEVR
jgi:hypothetical protein